MPRDSTIARARAELDAGRADLARDRLLGLHATFPGDQEILSLLGDVYLHLGDPASAGRFLFMTERDDPEADAALQAFACRHGGDAAQMFRRLKVVDASLLPPGAQERVLDLQAEARALGYPPPKARRGSAETGTRTWQERAQGFGCLIAFLGAALLSSVGLLALLFVIGRLFGRW